MRRILFAFVFSMITATTFSQFVQPDSIRKLLVAHNEEDSQRVLLLSQMAKAMLYTNPDSMMYYADEVLRLSGKIKWQQGIARGYQIKGVCYSYVLNNQIAALDCYQKALNANFNPVNKDLEYQTVANISVLFYNQKQYDEALKYSKKALELHNEIKSKNGESQLLLNIGNIYYDQQKIDTAKIYFQKSLYLAEKENNILITIGALNAFSTFYIEENSYLKAEPYAQKALFLSKKENNILTKSVSLVNMALIKLNLNELDSAEQYGKEALDASNEAKSMQFQRQSWNALSEIYEKKGLYKEALFAVKQFSNLNDSLLSDQSKQEVARKQMQFEDEKKEAVLIAKHTAAIKEERTKSNFIFTAAGIVILASIIIFVLYKRRRDAEEKKHEAEFKTQVSDTELKALRAQMNPHFIFNSLNSINNYIAKNEPRVASEYLHNFARIMRMILENSEKKSIPLSEELKTLELYMQLESKRLDDKFDYSIKVADDIDQENTLVPPMILQPFVENSIWHGISNKEGKGNIRIDISRSGQMLHCIIDDDGLGRKKTAPPASTKDQLSLGMKITKARIDIINKTKKSQGTVELFDLAKGMRVSVNLPFELSF